MNLQAPDPMLGRLIDGRYRVRSRVARGGMATVYLATDLRLERQVALKVMHGHLTDDSAFRDRFIQEARSAARLAHPNVVNVFDQGQDQGLGYLVMEYLPGITLRELLNEHGRLTPSQTIDVLEAVLGGLSAAHRAGIVHRDLKPENVLLADDGRIKIGDFGLARAATAATATGQALLGTVAYLSPELVTRGVADKRSDLYAIGIMMYEMLTGEQPFKGDQPMQIAYQHANESVPPPSAKVPSVPAELDELVLWATSRDPEHRPADASVLLEGLNEAERAIGTGSAATSILDNTVVFADSALPAAPTQLLGATEQLPSSGPRSIALLEGSSQRRSRRGPWIFILVLLLAALAGGTGWYFGSGPGSKVTVPDVTNTTVDQATADLLAQELKVAEEQLKDYHPTIEEGRVVGTDPAADTAVDRGTEVSLIISEGPRPIDVPALLGLELEEARALVESTGFVLSADTPSEFNADTAKGRVLRVLDSEGEVLAEGDTYFDQREVTLVVSEGPVPSVRGLSFDEAKAELVRVGLEVLDGTDSAFSDSIEKDLVIRIVPQKTALVPGSKVRLEISKGPDVVEIPDVAGKTINEATAILEQADFKVAYDKPFWAGPGEGWKNAVRVGSTSPAIGTTAKRNSVITLHDFYI